MTEELEILHGLWVPRRELRRFEAYGMFEGAPDIDVRKSAEAIRYCSSYALAIDVGAHVGAGTAYYSKKFDSVVAFEPIKETFEALKKNVENLPNAIAYEMAASDRAQQLYFEFVPVHSQLSHVVEGDETKFFGDRSILIGPVEARTIDSFGFENVSFIKIDVEGSEADVIRGALETIRQSRPTILVEQGGNERKFHQRPTNEASELLESLGMSRVMEFGFAKDRVYRFA